MTRYLSLIGCNPSWWFSFLGHIPVSRSLVYYSSYTCRFPQSCQPEEHGIQPKPELTQQALEQIEANIRDGGKPEVYLQFDLLEQFPQLMKPGNLRPETMKWKNTPGLFKRIPTLPTLMVKPTIWDKWCDRACAYWEPTQLTEDFCPGVALVVCYSHTKIYHRTASRKRRPSPSV